MFEPTDALRQAFISNNQGAIIHTLQFHHEPTMKEDIYICSDGIDREFKDENDALITYKTRAFQMSLPRMDGTSVNSYNVVVSNADRLFNKLAMDIAQSTSTMQVTYRMYVGPDGVKPGARQIRLYALNGSLHGALFQVELGFMNIGRKQFPDIYYDTKTFPNIRLGERGIRRKL